MGHQWIMLWWWVVLVTAQEVELNERDRVQEYYNRGYLWPLPEVK
jgi:hypothetical protein